MYRSLSIKIILLLIFGICNSEVNFGPECQYEGDMCKVDPEHCIRKMRNERVLISPCYGLYYGSGMLYDTRQDTRFWISVDERERESYPKDVTYSIYSKKSRKTDWSVPDSLSVITGCCSLTLKDSCVLPKREPGERQFVFMPLNQDPYNNWYCQYDLEEAIGKMEACKDDDEVGCLEFVNGIPRKRYAFIPLSGGETLTLKIDYCFFEPSNKLALDFENLTKGDEPVFESTGKFAGAFEDIENSCVIAENITGRDVRELAADYQTQGKEVICFFVRVKEVSGDWISQPACVRRNPVELDERGNPSSFVAIVAVATTCALLAVIATSIAVVAVVKRREGRRKSDKSQPKQAVTRRTETLP